MSIENKTPGYEVLHIIFTPQGKLGDETELQKG